METEKNNYLVGTIGAFIGAIIGAIPWVLMYVFGNMMYSLLAIIIIIGSYYGYRVTKAKIDKKLPVILSIASFVSITITMYIIIPICLMAKSGVPINLQNFSYLYQSDAFSAGILEDYLISLLFCIVAISGIVVSINRQIKEGVDSKEIRIFAKDVDNAEFSKKDIEKVKNIFEKNNATNKENTISKEIILEELTSTFDETKGKRIWNYLTSQQVIKKKAGGYYFSKESQKNFLTRYGLSGLKTFILVLIIATILACIIVFTGNESQPTENLLENNDGTSTDDTYELGVDNITLKMPDDMVILSDEQISSYFTESYLNAYDAIAVSGDFEKMILVFTDQKSNYDTEYTAEEYLKMALEDEEVPVEEYTFNGHVFYAVTAQYQDLTGKTYITTNCVYDAGDRFICIMFDSPEEDTINIMDVIQ